MILRLLLAYAVAALVFLCLDAAWLATMTPTLYRPALAHLMAERVDLASAAAFYAVYFLGVAVFAVEAGSAAPRAWRALGRGALFGLVAYATYDLTNQATLRDWPWRVTVADLAWGAFATAVAAACARAALARLPGPRAAA